jgi:hypothetical protein
MYIVKANIKDLCYFSFPREKKRSSYINTYIKKFCGDEFRYFQGFIPRYFGPYILNACSPFMWTFGL